MWVRFKHKKSRIRVYIIWDYYTWPQIINFNNPGWVEQVMLFFCEIMQLCLRLLTLWKTSS